MSNAKAPGADFSGSSGNRAGGGGRWPIRHRWTSQWQGVLLLQAGLACGSYKHLVTPMPGSRGTLGDPLSLEGGRCWPRDSLQQCHLRLVELDDRQTDRERHPGQGKRNRGGNGRGGLMGA